MSRSFIRTEPGAWPGFGGQHARNASRCTTCLRRVSRRRNCRLVHGLEPDGGDALAARIAGIRAEIAAGRYLTPEKLDVAVERLIATALTDPPRRAAATG
ncbi:MAG: hypothetical protein AB1716_01490 [Planctomycetota bacterium]